MPLTVSARGWRARSLGARYRLAPRARLSWPEASRRCEDGWPPCLPGSARGPTGSAAEPLALAREVVAGDPAFHRALLPLGRLRGAHDRRLLRDSVHRALSAGHLR